MCDLAPVFGTASSARAVIRCDGAPVAKIVASESLPRRLVLAVHVDVGGADTLALDVRFENLVPVDPRLLGLGLVSLDVDFDHASGAQPR